MILLLIAIGFFALLALAEAVWSPPARAGPLRRSTQLNLFQPQHAQYRKVPATRPTLSGVSLAAGGIAA